MNSSTDVLNAATMTQALQRHGVVGLQSDVFDALPSTSEYLMETAKANPSTGSMQPRLCVTDWQTSGNGRRGKTWVTARGNITFSLLVNFNMPPAELMGLSLVTGICVAQSIQAQSGVAAQLKWPNDVLVQNKKLCGLLTEIATTSAKATSVVVGIGINYTPPAAMDKSDFTAVSLPMLCNNPPARSDLISAVCARLLVAFEQFQTNGWTPFAEQWDRLDYLKGRQIRLINAQGEERVQAMGVNEQGALLVESDGSVRAVFGGDVSTRLA